MPVKKLSIALEEGVAARVAESAERHGLSLSAWVNALALEDGLAAVAEWQAEHGELSAEELAAADAVLDSKPRRRRQTA